MKNVLKTLISSGIQIREGHFAYAVEGAVGWLLTSSADGDETTAAVE